MTIREASFSDLFRISFWVQLGPALGACLLAGLLFSGLLLGVPDLPEALALLGFPGWETINPNDALLALWGLVAVYALLSFVTVALKSAAGAVFVLSWRRIFMKDRADA